MGTNSESLHYVTFSMPVISHLLGPCITLSTLFPNTLNLSSSFGKRADTTHYKIILALKNIVTTFKTSS